MTIVQGFSIMEHMSLPVSLTINTAGASYSCQHVTPYLHWALLVRRPLKKYGNHFQKLLAFFDSFLHLMKLQMLKWKNLKDMWFCCTLERHNSLLLLQSKAGEYSSVTCSTSTTWKACCLSSSICLGLDIKDQFNTSKWRWKLDSRRNLVPLWSTMPEASKVGWSEFELFFLILNG